jgi:hypothetical protein
MKYFACKELTRLSHLLLQTNQRRNHLAADSPAYFEVEEELIRIHAKISAHRHTCLRCNNRQAVEAPTESQSNFESREFL